MINYFLFDQKILQYELLLFECHLETDLSEGDIRGVIEAYSFCTRLSPRPKILAIIRDYKFCCGCCHHHQFIIIFFREAPLYQNV